MNVSKNAWRGSLCLLSFCACAMIGAEPEPANGPFSPQQAKAHQQAWAKHLGVPVEITDSLGMKFALIPPGQCTMGSPADEEWHRDDETLHRVTLTRPFYMSTTEVTQRQWKAVMGDAPSFCEGDDLPVETVPWGQTVEFCRKLSEKEGASYRLPSEAQWEYACRAGTTTPFHMGKTTSPDQANYDGNSNYAGGPKGVFREATTDVGSFEPNAWGLHDMHGNVWEWCADWYAEYPKGDSVDPTGPPQGEKRVIRGGCWINFPAVCRSANRGKTNPVSWNFNFGFRVTRVAE